MELLGSIDGASNENEGGENTQLRISMSVGHTLSVPHNPPADPTSVGKRMLNNLPAFTCVCYSMGPDDVPWMLAGRKNGDVVGWKIPSEAFDATSPINNGGGGLQSTKQQKARNKASLSSSSNNVLLDHFVLGQHRGAVTCVARCDINGHRLAITGSADTNVKIWDPWGSPFPGRGRCTQTLAAHDATVTSIAIHMDIVLTGSVDKTMKMWRFDEGRDHLCFPWLSVKQIFIFEHWVTAVWASERKVAESTQGEIFVGDAGGGMTVLRSTGDDTLRQVVPLRYARMCGMDFKIIGDANTDRATTASSTKTTGAIVANDGRLGFTKILPLPLMNQLITLSYENFARVSDIVDFEAFAQIPHPDPKGRFIDVAWNDEHEEVVLLDDKGIIFLWDCKASKFRASFFAGHNATALIIPCDPKPSIWIAHRQGIDKINVQRYSTFVEYAGHTGRILGLYINPSSIFEKPTATNNALTAVANSTTNASAAAPAAASDEFSHFYLVSAAADNSLRLWSPSMVCLATLNERGSEISCLCALVGLPWLITGHDSGSMKFWSLVQDRSFRFTAHENTVTAVCEGSHRGVKGRIEPWQHIFSVSFDGCLAVWELPLEGSKAKCEARLRVAHCELVCAVYDDINFTYIVGDSVGRVSIWSVDELKPLRMLNHPAVPSVAITPTGPSTSPSAASSRKPSSAATQQLLPLPAHAEAVTWLTLDGNMVFSGGEDERIFIWNSITGDCVKELVVAGDFPGAPGEIQHFVTLPEQGDLLCCTRNGYMILFSQTSGLAVSYYRIAVEVSRVAYNRFSGDVIAGRDDGLLMRIPLALFTKLQFHHHPGIRRSSVDTAVAGPTM